MLGRMSLSLIVGPPNSGRAGVVRERLTAALDRDPVLIVPTLEDISRFERELCAADDAVLGVSILTFKGLFEEVVRVTGAPVRPSLTAVQARHLARRAISSTRLRILARSARRPGFAAALAAVIEEFQAGCLDPRTVAELADRSDDSRYLGELGELYSAYIALRDELGFGDSHVAAAEATAALRVNREAWGPRPVLLYGFDDMTVEQLELVGALADVTEVTATVTFEDREALAARSSLRGELVARGADVIDERRPDPAHTESQILYHLERGFLVGGCGRRALDPGLVLMEAAGERGQAEQIGVEVARLLAAGAPADEIAVVLRNPDRDGALYESVFARLGIPAAVEARIPLERTAVGRALCALLRASFGSRSANDLLKFVRTPGRAHADQADWLERTIRRHRLRTADQALEAWRGRELFELGELRDAAGPRELLLALSRLARMIAEYPYERDAPHPERERTLELRAAAEATAAFEEVAALPGIEDGPAEALACLEALEVPLWRGPSDGHVRVTSPYRIRARRVEHLFVASLQEGEFPRHEAGEPLLSDDQRAELSLTPRSDPDEEERYLFYVCLSRPTRRLHLCWRSCDDEGAPAAPSPLLDDVRDLLEPAPPEPDEPDPLDSIIRRRTLADVTLTTDQASTPDELARALAARPRRNGVEVPAELKLGHSLEQTLRSRLDRAAERAELSPGPIRTPAVIDALRDRRLFGASTLEGYALCSYRWFVDHELGPQGLDPDPDPLVHGSVIHLVLESLYRDPPGPDPRPRPDSLGAWRARAAELTTEFAADAGLGSDDARSAAARARIEALVGGFLGREARTASPLRPEPELIEASFGRGEDDSRPALDLGGFELHGKVDRVDVTAGDEPAGLIRDYKASRLVTPAAKLAEEGKLQLPLYAHALARLWGVRPLGGIYEPLAATDDPRPRGFVRGDEKDGALAGLDLVTRDLLADDAFEAVLSDAAETAAEIVEAMRAGRIDRDPIDDECPRYCTFQAICRRERAARQAPAPGDEEEEPE
jgi:ATP-dependent helicase/DNAse subunit B